MNLEFEKKIFDSIAQLVSDSTTITIVTHTNPDGDAIGSSLAWAGVLKNIGKEVRVILPNNCPDYLQWIGGYTDVLFFDSNKKNAVDWISKSDLFFCLDFNTYNRIEELGALIENAPGKHALIDHHPCPTIQADAVLSVIEASSTSELIYHTIKGCGYEAYLNSEIAEALYVGIITDTGGLSHASSRPQIYTVIGDLLANGVDKIAIHDKLFNVFSYSRMQLLGKVLKDNFVYLPEYQSAYLFISLEDQKKYDFQVGDAEGFVNYPLGVKDILFCAMFTEYEKNQTKMSFRSKYNVPANGFAAKYFAGGGHLNAAGARKFASLQECIDVFVKGLKESKDDLLVKRMMK